MPEPKTLKDFPQFNVSAVRRGEISAKGFTNFELEGQFDRNPISDQGNWFYLLSDGKGLCVSIQSFDRETGKAVFTSDTEDELPIAGQSLTYLRSAWQPYKIWMILGHAGAWTRKPFSGEDAVAEDYDSGETSMVDGREVRVWTKVEPAAGSKGVTRYYPATDQTLPPSTERRPVSGAWDHEHCGLCNIHIDAGDIGYSNPDENWLCEKCYERYAVPRDLAFIDEL